MHPQLIALRRDPRFVASTAAILWLLDDDNPAGPIGTFRDPGAALMLSIVFGDSLALAIQRRWDVIGIWVFGVSFVLKLFGQLAFYVQNARVVDSLFLLATHFLIALAACHGLRPIYAALRVFAGILAVVLALVILRHYELSAQRDHSIALYFYTFAAARALIPYLFWTAMITVRSYGSANSSYPTS